jgi:hypothetical protein
MHVCVACGLCRSVQHKGRYGLCQQRASHAAGQHMAMLS